MPENESGRGFEGNKEGKYLTISPGGTKAPQSNYDIDLLAFDYAWMKHGMQLVASQVPQLTCIWMSVGWGS